MPAGKTTKQPSLHWKISGKVHKAFFTSTWWASCRSHQNILFGEGKLTNRVCEGFQKKIKSLHWKSNPFPTESTKVLHPTSFIFPICHFSPDLLTDFPAMKKYQIEGCNVSWAYRSSLKRRFS